MSWMNMLYQTYEHNKQFAGTTDGTAMLSVIAHMTANSHLEITINEAGEFLSASPVEKEDGRILIPVTEASASRSSGVAPHALNDMLPYIAGDYISHVPEEQREKTGKKFQAYIKNLYLWKKSEFSHPKVRAIYKYISKENVIQDLITYRIIELDENNLFKNEKISGQFYDKVMVRFRVAGGNPTAPKATWKDTTLMECYTQYYLSVQSGKKNICFITGNNSVITNNHPKGIVAANYGAKLVSANDTTNFTFRGRFTDADEACTVSYEASQKSHNALSWLAEKQGVLIGMKDKRTYICWNPKGKNIPFMDDPLCDEDDKEEITDTEEGYKKKLAMALQGYKNQLDDNDDIVIIGLDAATTGRLSIVCYDELKSSTFLSHLKDWNETCNWYFTKFTKDKRPYQTIYTPTAKQIIRCAYGTEQGQFLDVGDKLLKEQVQRIYYCIIEKMALPKDIVHALMCRASDPQAYKIKSHYETVLSTACALIKKSKGGSVLMVLDEKNTDRSYLFGRLLAVAEVAEKNAMEANADRPTNATRMQTAFVNRPFSTWNNINNALNPYLQRLSVGSREYYEKWIQDIMCRFKEEDLKDMNRNLKPEYLLGYYLQRKALYTKKEKKEVVNTSENAQS
ncbi:MAG: type I-C CRISPR-associated protein Cas8c/Csd1 [Clostridiales bacterium]|nr:type I-C CRISPR-associated protein Cas8c/Csd1 [Clostridiales bacterium]